MRRETRILIFGQSNTGGFQLADAGTSWPSLLAAAWPGIFDSPVSVTVRTFFAHAPGSDEYIERELKKYEPDIVFLMLTTFSFTAQVMEPGIRHRFGDRAGDAFSRLVNRFDRATRHRGVAAQRLNRSTRKLATRIFPTSPVGSYEVAVEGTTRALGILARNESIQSMAIHGFVRLPVASSGRKSTKAVLVERFLDEMQATTARLRMEYLNLQNSPEAQSDRWYFPDGLHITPEAHQAIAARVLAKFHEGRLLPVEDPRPGPGASADSPGR